MSCQIGSIVSDLVLAEAENTYRKIPKISPSMYKPPKPVMQKIIR